MKTKFDKIVWKCLSCGEVRESDPLKHHKMDYCIKCGESGVDLETYSCRVMGNVKFLKRISPNFLELRVKPCWGTYGINGLSEFKKVSVSEMSIGHMKAILNEEKPGEYIKWLIKREIKLKKSVKQELDLCFELQGFCEEWDLNDGLKKYINLVDKIRLDKINIKVLDSF